MAVTGNTELLATKAAIISAMVQKELAASSKLLGTVQDVSAYAGPGMKSISFPKFGSFTVEERVSGAASVPQALTATVDTLSLDVRATISWQVDSMDALQSSVQVQSEYIKRAAQAHGAAVDAKLIAAVEAGAGYNQGALTTVTEAVLLDMLAYLEGNYANMNELSLVVGVDQKKAMLQIANFIRADAIGFNGATPISTGVFGMIYGVPVIVKPGLAAGKVYMYDKSAVAIGFQRAASYGEVANPLLGVGSVTSVVDQLYGVKVLQDNALSAGSGLSPLIAKM
jgi:hypothetical protein